MPPEYKHVVLGLLFLKYISDSFQSQRDELEAELTKVGIKPAQIEKLLESRDEYTAERVFWVPPESRWSNLQNQATRPDGWRRSVTEFEINQRKDAKARRRKGGSKSFVFNFASLRPCAFAFIPWQRDYLLPRLLSGRVRVEAVRD